MWVLSPRRNCSLSTLAEKKSTWMRSMITAMANTRHIAIGYMPGPPPFQWCATVSKKDPIVPSLCLAKCRKFKIPCRGSPAAPPRSRPAGERKMGADLPGCNRALPAALRHPSLRNGGPWQRPGQTSNCASFRAPMAREISFPRTRHVALFGFGQQAEAKVGDNEAILVPIGVAADAAAGRPPAGVPLPPPPQPGAPGVPEKGALPAAAPGEALAAGVQEPAPQAHTLPWVVVVDVAAPAGDVDRCRGLDGAPAPVRCASSLEGRQHAGDAAARAALLGEAVMLSGLDRWYALGPAGAGYCRSCEMAFMEYLREGYGDHMQPFDGLDPLRNSALPVRERPFALQKQAHRLSEALAAGKRAVLRARDEARRARSVEIAVLGRVGPLSGMALEMCRHLDGLVFELSSLDAFAELLPFLAARAALGVRPVVAVLPEGATVAQVRQFAALATACDCDLMLGEDAPEEAQAALAGHRAFMALVRERYRPAAPLVDLELLFSPRCDHWSDGRHQRASAAALATLARGQWPPAV